MSGPVNEWIIHDTQSLRDALDGMRRKRKLSFEGMFHRLGGRTIGAFLKGRQDNVRSDSLISAVNGLEFELVIREPQRTRTMQRLEALRAESRQAKKDSLVLAMEEQASGVGRDESGKLTRELTPQERAQVEELLERYSNL